MVAKIVASSPAAAMVGPAKALDDTLQRCDRGLAIAGSRAQSWVDGIPTTTPLSDIVPLDDGVIAVEDREFVL